MKEFLLIALRSGLISIGAFFALMVFLWLGRKRSPRLRGK